LPFFPFFNCPFSRFHVHLFIPKSHGVGGGRGVFSNIFTPGVSWFKWQWAGNP
jgi:hypothetical protein